MRMIDEIVLVTVTESTHAGGSPTYTRTNTTVFADAKSAKRTEWYSANHEGIKADIAFEMHADEYSDQTEVIFGAHTYRVIRSYAEKTYGNVELICERMAGHG